MEPFWLTVFKSSLPARCYVVNGNSLELLEACQGFRNGACVAIYDLEKTTERSGVLPLKGLANILRRILFIQ
jgi:hypothetical protein